MHRSNFKRRRSFGKIQLRILRTDFQDCSISLQYALGKSLETHNGKCHESHCNCSRASFRLKPTKPIIPIIFKFLQRFISFSLICITHRSVKRNQQNCSASLNEAGLRAAATGACTRRFDRINSIALRQSDLHHYQPTTVTSN